MIPPASVTPRPSHDVPSQRGPEEPASGAALSAHRLDLRRRRARNRRQAKQRASPRREHPTTLPPPGRRQPCPEPQRVAAACEERPGPIHDVGRGTRSVRSGLLSVPDNPHMSRLAAFYGIVIWMYRPDHPAPHFHAQYGEVWPRSSSTAPRAQRVTAAESASSRSRMGAAAPRRIGRQLGACARPGAAGTDRAAALA